MLVLLTGASGFLGTALRRHLEELGHETRQLVRGEPSGPDQVRWDPYAGDLPANVLDGVGAVVNLSGAPIARWPWTASYKRTILDSRVKTTRTLAEALASALPASEHRPPLFNASGVGLYGDRGDEILDESSAPGDTFLAEVVQQWEAATRPYSEAGGRVVLGRTAPVLDKSGGTLALLKLPFRLGLGGRLGSGRQWFASIALDDYVRAVERALTDPQMSGAYNLCAPEPATNADLTRLLGRVLHRPTILPVPAVALRVGLGELSSELLGSLRVRPARLLESGFEFRHPDLESELLAAFA